MFHTAVLSLVNQVKLTPEIHLPKEDQNKIKTFLWKTKQNPSAAIEKFSVAFLTEVS